MTDRFKKLKELAAALPAEYKVNAEALLERMSEVVEGIGDDAQEWRPGLLRLIQGTTDRSGLPKGVGIGEFVLGDKKLEQPLEIFVLRMWDNRQYWDPDPTNSKMLCSSPDAKLGYIGKNCRECEHGKWNEETSRSECSKVKTIMAIRADLSDIFLTNFQKTSYAAGMELEGQMKKAGVATYKRGYALSSKTHQKQKNVETYAVEPLSGEKRVTPEALLPFLGELFAIVSGDRKAHLEKFYETIKLKVENQSKAALTGNSGSDTTLVLTDDATPAAPAAEAAVSPLSKNYQV